MKHAEEHKFCLDCWQENKPAFKSKKPAEQHGDDDRTELTHRANSIWSSSEHGGFGCLVLYADAGDDWEEIERWS